MTRRQALFALHSVAILGALVVLSFASDYMTRFFWVPPLLLLGVFLTFGRMERRDPRRRERGF